jgi:hypothetical protein
MAMTMTGAIVSTIARYKNLIDVLVTVTLPKNPQLLKDLR